MSNLSTVQYFTISKKSKKIMLRKLAGSLCINPQNKKFAFLLKTANFKGVRVGRGLHFEHMLEIRTAGYLFHPHVNLKIKNYQKSTKIIYFPSIPPSIKSTKIKHFTTFIPSKITIILPQKSLKPLQIKSFLELARKSRI